MQFNVFFDTAGSPNLGDLTAAEQQAILDTANAAAQIWSWYLTPANITLDYAIAVDNSAFGSLTLAQTGVAEWYATGATFGGEAVRAAITTLKLQTGSDGNGSDADFGTDLTVNSIRNLLYFKTDPNGSVPSGRYDALSVFLHEIGHGLGIIYTGDEPSFGGATVYDTFVQGSGFTGANAEQAYWQ